ncbi:OmpA family protein [Corallococcus sp. M7]
MHRYAVGGAVLGLLLATPARAQDATALPTFSLERLDPNPGLGPLALGSGELLTPGALRLSLMAHYQHSSLRIPNGLLEPSLVLSRTTALVSMAVGVLPWLELQAQLPGVIHQSGADLSTSMSIASPSRSGLGAPRIAARFGLLGTSAPEAFHLALDLDTRLPVGGSGALARDRGVRGQGRVMMGKRWGAVAPAMEVGVLLRRSVSGSSVDRINGVGNELRAGVGLTMGYAFRAEVSALGAYSFRQQRVSGELLGGLRYAPVRPWEFFVMGGAGLGSEPGMPRFRVLAGVALLLFDKPPRPPPEDIVYELVTGLPRAPAEPQLEPEPTPSEPPPSEPTPPEPSRDVPGLETDTDGDGVVDALDACVHEQGTREYSGCPETGDPLVTLTRERLVLHGQVFFEVGATTLPGRSRVLDQVARVLLEHPEVERVVIEGHTDAEGSSASNQRLSLARAEAVRDYLMRKGVPAHRLEARGLGARRPAGSNGTQSGRGENRRAELLLILGEPTSARTIPATPPQ